MSLSEVRERIRSGQYEIAAEEAEKLSRTAPGPGVVTEWARALLRGGRLDDAATVGARAAADGPDGALVWVDILLARGAVAEAWVGAEACVASAVASGSAAEAAKARCRWASVLISRGELHQALGEVEGALRSAEEAGDTLDWDERMGIRSTHAEALLRLECWQEARAVWRTLRAEARARLPDGHPELATLDDHLGLCLCRLGEPLRALRLHEAAARSWAHRGPAHPGRSANLHHQGQALRRLGRLRDAAERLAEAARLTERLVGRGHPDLWISRFELGRVLFDLGEVGEGVAMMEEAREVLTRTLGPLHPTVSRMAALL